MSYCNTIFYQMLKLIPRLHFAKLEAEYSTGRKARSFTRWSQLVHLISMQLTAQTQSAGRCLQPESSDKGPLPPWSQAGSPLHLCRCQPPPASFFEALLGLIYRRCQPLARKHQFKFKNKVYSLVPR